MSQFMCPFYSWEQERKKQCKDSKQGNIQAECLVPRNFLVGDCCNIVCPHVKIPTNLKWPHQLKIGSNFLNYFCLFLKNLAFWTCHLVQILIYSYFHFFWSLSHISEVNDRWLNHNNKDKPISKLDVPIG